MEFAVKTYRGKGRKPTWGYKIAVGEKPDQHVYSDVGFANADAAAKAGALRLRRLRIMGVTNDGDNKRFRWY